MSLSRILSGTRVFRILLDDFTISPLSVLDADAQGDSGSSKCDELRLVSASSMICGFATTIEDNSGRITRLFLGFVLQK